MVKLILECENCGNKVELVSKQQGHQVQMSRLNQENFTLNTPDIDKDGDIEDIEDVDDIDVEICAIRIDCNNCGDYIVLEDF